MFPDLASETLKQIKRIESFVKQYAVLSWVLQVLCFQEEVGWLSCVIWMLAIFLYT